MFEKLLSRLLAPAPEPLAAPDSQLALAALLVRAARADGLYAAEEVERIDRVLMKRHALGPFEAAKLRVEAETLENEAPDTVRFTRALKEATPLEERDALLEALWSVVMADGLRDAQEDRLMRLVANLLGLSDVQNAQARQRAGREA
ncbi:TerB family tellurite resistance protein [Pseudogemmobacter sonorensis]|uniref:tellurite resistance TerB family protein n=1 Tax=Pseudogemmobacter sonorensis TaxID=2989681 RepID=UPI00367377D0